MAPQVVDPSPSATSQPEPEPVIPEITLDKELEEKQKAKRAELEKFAKEIGSANSLEEFSDAMAETLFGNEEFEAIAAEVVANVEGDGKLCDECRNVCSICVHCYCTIS